MNITTDAELYRRGTETLVAAWDEYARGAVGAALHRLPGVSVAVFPNEPERSVYNNAVLEQDLADAERSHALDAMETAYAAAGMTHYAAWVHERDQAMSSELERRGYKLNETTRAMGIALDDIRLPRPEIEVTTPDWDEYLEYLRAVGFPPGLLRRVDHRAFHVVAARIGDDIVATAMAFDFGTDRGIYNVSTLERARRRGFGTALTAALLHDARSRGRRTASLQSTEMAEGVYEAAGFRDLGGINEYMR